MGQDPAGYRAGGFLRAGRGLGGDMAQLALSGRAGLVRAALLGGPGDGGFGDRGLDFSSEGGPGGWVGKRVGGG